jgi:hypothetical protein
MQERLKNAPLLKGGFPSSPFGGDMSIKSIKNNKQDDSLKFKNYCYTFITGGE